MQLQAGVVTAVLGSVITFSFGIWQESLTLLAVLMGVDYISGVVAAIRSDTGLNSSVGFWGLGKKGLSLLVILLSHRIDALLGTNMVMGGAVSFYVVNELLSVLENYGRLGLPLPGSLRRAVQILRDKTDDGNNGQSD